MIRFKKQWFNPLYYILEELVKDDSIRTILIYGGKSSSKTLTICQILVKEAVSNKASSVGYRKESSNIAASLKESFNAAINTMFMTQAVEEQDKLYICKSGAKIMLRGISNEEKAKGLMSFKFILLDELNQFDKGDYNQLQMSLRGEKGQKVFATWNPVDENNWVKTDLVDTYEWVDTKWKLPCEDSFVKISTSGKVVLIKTTYQDNYWIAGSPCGKYGFKDENLIAFNEELRTKDYNSYKVNVLGEWGKVQFGGEFLKRWKSEIHTGHYPYDPSCAIYLSFDENVNPYFPCGFFQLGRDGKSPRLIHCIAAKNPDNTVKSMCREIIRKFREWNHRGRLFICGDATSVRDDVKLEKGHDLYRLIASELREFTPYIQVNNSNPSVTMSADFFNSILDGTVRDMSFGADNKCRVAIIDYENTKEDKNGKVDKKTVVNPVTRVSYQPYGHFVDLTRYFLVTTYSREYDLYQSGGQVQRRPSIRFGSRPKFQWGDNW